MKSNENVTIKTQVNNFLTKTNALRITLSSTAIMYFCQFLLHCILTIFSSRALCFYISDYSFSQMKW